jgi:hypothetical protein
MQFSYIYENAQSRLNSLQLPAISKLTKYTIVSNEGILPQSFLHDYEIDDVDQYLLEVLLLYGLAYL